METLKNIAKATAVMGIVGLVLAAISLPMAHVLGAGVLGDVAMAAAEHSGATILWTGAFFGAFGGIHAAVAPAVDFVLGKAKGSVAATQPVKEAECCTKECDMGMGSPDINPVAFAKRIEAERAETKSPTLSA